MFGSYWLALGVKALLTIGYIAIAYIFIIDKIRLGLKHVHGNENHYSSVTIMFLCTMCIQCTCYNFM